MVKQLVRRLQQEKSNSIRAQRELISAAVIKRAVYYNHKHPFKQLCQVIKRAPEFVATCPHKADGTLSIWQKPNEICWWALLQPPRCYCQFTFSQKDSIRQMVINSGQVKKNYCEKKREVVWTSGLWFKFLSTTESQQGLAIHKLYEVQPS